MTTTVAEPIDRSIVAVFPYLAGGLASAVPLLLVPASVDRQVLFLVHLAGLVLLGLALSVRLGPLVLGDWYSTP